MTDKTVGKSNGFKMLFMAFLPILYLIGIVLYSIIMSQPIYELVSVYIIPCMGLLILFVIIILVRCNMHLPKIQKVCPEFNVGIVNIKKIQKHLLEKGDVKNSNKIKELLQVRNLFASFFLGFVVAFFLLMLIIR